MSLPGPVPVTADTPVQYLKGVGPARAAQLARLGVATAADLLHHYPIDYSDAASRVALRELRAGMVATTRGRLLDVGKRPLRGRGRSMLSALLADGPARLQLVWFNAPWLEGKLHAGDEIVVSGKVEQYRGSVQMVNPTFEPAGSTGELEDPRPRPRYPLTAGLKQAPLRRVVALVVEALADGEPEPLPAPRREALGLPTRAQALRWLHLPDDLEQAAAGRARLAFDEALALQLAVGIRRAHLLRRPAAVRLGDFGDLSTRYVEGLGFTLTGAQRRVLSAIAKDLRGEVAMHRLLQGDVGSGKTLVALVAMLWAAEAGGQAAFMAPTEVLARQHGDRQRERLAQLGLESATLTGSTPAAERRTILRGLASGDIQVAFGTHALIQEGVEFARLGLAVVDEQHRFGVLQRAALSGGGAHLLVMSATPIPRSLALTVYGDLDLSILDEKPPGRTPIRTRAIPGAQAGRALQRVREAAARGERAYLVYPLVEESEGEDRASAERAFVELGEGELSGLRLGLLHGKLPNRQKVAVAEAFARGELDALVATTVVEVGLDVPEATVMVVHEADRFGLAQLHQLRGRVGRGPQGGECWLVASDGIGDRGRRRLELLCSSDDGFVLAEEDLRARGMGDLHGIRQSGELPFRLLNPLRDEALVASARELSREWLDEDPELASPAYREARRWLDAMGRRNPLWSAAG